MNYLFVICNDCPYTIRLMSLKNPEMSTNSPHKMTSLASEIIAQVAPKLGLIVNIEPEYRYVGQILTPDGRKFYFRNTNFDLNGQGASEMARDKDYANYYMKLMGYNVPEGRAFYSPRWCKSIGSDQNIDAGYTYAHDRGFPVIVKPNSKSQGFGVAKVYTKTEYYRAMRYVFNEAHDRVGVVQDVINGDDYRIVVLDDEIISAYRRVPLSITGDGKHSIIQLIEKKQQEFNKRQRDTIIPIDDYRIPAKLQRSKMTMASIPERRQTIPLLDNSNLSTGGEAVDVTDSIHPTFSDLAIRLTKDMGLRYCGVDLMTPDPIDQPLQHYTIIEINAAPGVDHYAESGPHQKQIVESMYEKILKAMVNLR